MAWNQGSLLKLLDFFFYRGERVGKHGGIFKMWKFRTMLPEGEKLGAFSGTENDDCYSVANDNKRITGIGRILRKTHLDELPNLINVLKGDMALFGPRPECVFYVNKMSPEERAIILSVRPGCIDFATLGNLDEGKQLEGKEDPEKYYEEVIWPIKKKRQIESIQKGFWGCIEAWLFSGKLDIHP